MDPSSTKICDAVRGAADEYLIDPVHPRGTHLANVAKRFAAYHESIQGLHAQMHDQDKSIIDHLRAIQVLYKRMALAALVLGLSLGALVTLVLSEAFR